MWRSWTKLPRKWLFLYPIFLLYSCPNPFDVTPSHETPATLPEGMANHVRRFTVSTFQFLENSRKEMVPGEDVEEVEENGEEEEVNTQPC